MKAAVATRRFVDTANIPDHHPEYGKDHLRDMVSQMIAWDLTDPKIERKAHRWLGWLQCAIVMGGGASLEEMKLINKNS